MLEPFAGKARVRNHGERVVRGQQLIQASGDIFLGWQRLTGEDGVSHDYYVRQLQDWKASADVTGMTADALQAYGRLCGWTLARAHSRSGARDRSSATDGGGR